MAFQTPITIEKAIDHIHNNRFLLPAIRREFVWRPHQIERLFDSLMRGYPIGTFLFWRVDPETAKNYSFYQFITNYDQREPHNPVHRVPSTVPGLKAVLDGQQRLTALNIGLRGSIARKLPRRWWTNPDTSPTTKLYLDLLWQSDEDNDEGLKYRFRFLTNNLSRTSNDNVCWFPVSQVLALPDTGPVMIQWLNEQLPQKLITPAYKTLYELYQVVHNDGIISAYEEASQDPERVLNIFVRTNSGGTPLSYSDMLLSMAMTQWDKVDARKEIYALVDEINNIGRDCSFNRDFVLKACLMLGDSNSVHFKVENFGKSQIGTLQDQWDHIRSTITETVGLASSFGYSGQSVLPPLDNVADQVELAFSFGSSGQSLTSANALLPIAYFLHHCQPALNTKDRKAIRNWLIRSLLKRGFWNSGVDNLLMAIRRAIRESSCHDGFPACAIETALPSGKSLTFDDEELQDLADTEYGGRAYILLLLLYDFVDVATNQFHIDHVFPRALMTEARLKKVGISEEKIPEYLDRVNRLANLQLLEGSINIRKSAMLPAYWLSARYLDESERQHHCHLHDLGDVPTEIDGFLDFYETRQRRILEKLRHLLVSDSTENRDQHGESPEG